VFSKFLVGRDGGRRGGAGRSRDARQSCGGAFVPSGKNDKIAAVLRSREVRCMRVRRYRALPTLVCDDCRVKRSIYDNAAIVTLRKLLSCIDVRALPQACRTCVPR
jgi:hypothetical protein